MYSKHSTSWKSIILCIFNIYVCKIILNKFQNFNHTTSKAITRSPNITTSFLYFLIFFTDIGSLVSMLTYPHSDLFVPNNCYYILLLTSLFYETLSHLQALPPPSLALLLPLFLLLVPPWVCLLSALTSLQELLLFSLPGLALTSLRGWPLFFLPAVVQRPQLLLVWPHPNKENFCCSGKIKVLIKLINLFLNILINDENKQTADNP